MEHKCAVTTTDVSGRVWICVREVHQSVYHGRNGRVIYSNTPDSNFHIFQTLESISEAS